jgi:hypothetical protein
MGAVTKAVPSAVPSAVNPANSVPVNQKAQRSPYTAPTGSSVVPYVPDHNDEAETPWQPEYATTGKVGRTHSTTEDSAPSVPDMNGALFTAGPIDSHYHTVSGIDPYTTVGRPGTVGWQTWVKTFANHVFNGKQNVDNAGWQQNGPQQRTSYMRVTTPPHGPGYAPATSVPVQQPQASRTQRFLPATGTDQPGIRPGQAIVLNSTTYGAGQTAGGVGGNQYAPPVAPPDTTPVSAMSNAQPMWG